jgi:hypothetical protein
VTRRVNRVRVDGGPLVGVLAEDAPSYEGPPVQRAGISGCSPAALGQGHIDKGRCGDYLWTKESTPKTTFSC